MKKSNTKPRKSVHGTQEWAATNINIQSGCEHDCRYCYAKGNAVRFGRFKASDWRKPVINEKQVSRNHRNRDGRIMFPSSHDITPSNIDSVIVVLKKLLAAGNHILIVSKPEPGCIKRICTELADYRDQILFRFTIGSRNNSVLKYWEPNAPSFEKRLSALRWAYSKGFQTSVSAEPMLDTKIEKVIKAVRPYVTDAIWLGRANRLRVILSMTCPGDLAIQQEAAKLLGLQDYKWIHELYAKYRKDPMVRWKDSLKKIVGIELPSEKGLDI